MRNIRTTRTLILAFLAIFAMVIVGMIWRSSPKEHATPVAHPVPAAPAKMEVEGTVESAASTFSFTEERGGHIVTRLRAGRMLGMEGGSRVLSNIIIEFHPEPEAHPDRIARVQSDAGKFDTTRQEVVLQGNVLIHMASGEELATESLLYNLETRSVHTEDPVRFHLEGTSGTAVGMTAHLATEEVTLHHEVRISGETGTDGRKMLVKADQMKYDGSRGRSDLLGKVSLSGEWGSFNGRHLIFQDSQNGILADTSEPGKLTLHGGGDREAFSLDAAAWKFEFDDRRQLRAVEATGDALLRPTALSSGMVLKSLAAPRIRLEPAVSERPFHALHAFSSATDLVRASLASGSLETVTAERLDLESGSTEGDWARFSGTVQARGPGRTATGSILLARPDGTILLSGDEQAPARILEARRSLAAAEIQYDGDGGGRASGSVHLTGMATSQGKRLTATADVAEFSASSGVLRLEGSVRAWQGNDTLQAAWVEMDQPTSVLRAGGGVTTSMGSRGSANGHLTTTTRTRVKSQDLIWEREHNKALFSGHVLLTREGMLLQAATLDMLSSDEKGTAFTATGDVHLQDQEWSGTADRLTYAGHGDLYHLESDDGLATVTSLASGSILRGARLSVDPESGQAQVESLPGGRIIVRSRRASVGTLR
ncbi:MAG: LPS export ABC transporter periplasmic protein LptC [Acidobacteria bacterium]|nr:LPS export ABC transporter periplasmic protein LptC [Acidobacteriota bacterium]